MGKRTAEIQGARDLGALWRDLPLAGWRFPMPALPQGVGVLSLGNLLRAEVWRELCAHRQPLPCIDLHRPESQGDRREARCALANAGQCRADALIPVAVGGGAPQWRMATLGVHWHSAAASAASEVRLIALGATACDELAWAARFLGRRMGWGTGEPLEWTMFRDLVPETAGRWRIGLATPWLANKRATTAPPSSDETADGAPEPGAVEAAMYASLSARAHKFTALCSSDPLTQRLGGHLARHIAGAMRAAGTLRVVESGLDADRVNAADMGKGKDYEGLIWTGSFEVEASELALPWLGLAAATGLGENVDKGFGQILLKRSA